MNGSQNKNIKTLLVHGDAGPNFPICDCKFQSHEESGVQIHINHTCDIHQLFQWFYSLRISWEICLWIVDFQTFRVHARKGPSSQSQLDWKHVQLAPITVIRSLNSITRYDRWAPGLLHENCRNTISTRGDHKFLNSSGGISYKMDQWSWLYDHQIFILILRASRRHQFKPALTSTAHSNSPSSRVLQMF